MAVSISQHEQDDGDVLTYVQPGVPLAGEAAYALRRLRLLALAWSVAAVLSFSSGLAQMVFWSEDFGGREVLLNQPLDFYARLGMPVIAALLLGLSALLWRSIPSRPARLAGGLALAAAAALLVSPYMELADERFGWTYHFRHDPLRISRELLNWGAVSAVPLAVAWGAMRPASFGQTRLATLAAIAVLLLAMANATVIVQLAQQNHNTAGASWWAWLQGMRSHHGVAIMLMAAAPLLAAGLFAFSIAQRRRGGVGSAAVVASWILAILALWLCATTYGIWRKDWNALEPTRRLLSGVSMIMGFVTTLGLGLAFLMPLKRDRSDHAAARHY